jgi:hypothetical protein
MKIPNYFKLTGITRAGKHSTQYHVKRQLPKESLKNLAKELKSNKTLKLTKLKRKDFYIL